MDDVVAAATAAAEQHHAGTAEPGAQLELRVLAGARQGCRIPLRAGLYRMGSGARCDILIDTAAPDDGLVLYVGERGLALERLGAAAAALQLLVPGQCFALDAQLFAVDWSSALWPDSAALAAAPMQGAEDAGLADTAAAAQPSAASAAELAPEAALAEAPAEGGPPATDAALAHPIEQGEAAGAVAPGALPPLGKVVRTGRVWRWLAGATLVLGAGCTTVYLVPHRSGSTNDRHRSSAPPAHPVAASAPVDPLAAAVAAASDQGQLRLTRLADQRWRLSGYIHTSAQLSALAARLRQLAPDLRIDVAADDTLAQLARETLQRFAPQGEVELDELRDGQLSLRGLIGTEEELRSLRSALNEDLPALAAIHTGDVTCAEQALQVAQQLAEEAGLDNLLSWQREARQLHVRGRLDGAQQQRWLEVRQQFEARFGSSISLHEQLDVKPAPRQDVVLIVGGRVPYALLRNGDKLGGALEATP